MEFDKKFKNIDTLLDSIYDNIIEEEEIDYDFNNPEINDIYNYAMHRCEDFRTANAIVDALFSHNLDEAKSIMYNYINLPYKKKLNMLKKFEKTEGDIVTSRMSNNISGDYTYDTYDPNFDSVVKAKLHKSTITNEYMLILIGETKLN